MYSILFDPNSDSNSLSLGSDRSIIFTFAPLAIALAIASLPAAQAPTTVTVPELKSFEKPNNLPSPLLFFRR